MFLLFLLYKRLKKPEDCGNILSGSSWSLPPKAGEHNAAFLLDYLSVCRSIYLFKNILSWIHKRHIAN